MKPLVVVTLSIGEEKEVIEIFEKGDVERHARMVARKHGLKEEFVGYLRQELEGKIEIEMKRRRKGKKMGEGGRENLNIGNRHDFVEILFIYIEEFYNE